MAVQVAMLLGTPDERQAISATSWHLQAMARMDDGSAGIPPTRSPLLAELQNVQLIATISTAAIGQDRGRADSIVVD